MNPTAALPPGILFAQPLTPVANSLLLSFLVAVIPIAVALIALGVLRRPAWQASLAGLVAGLAVAIGAWGMPVGLAFNAVGAGMALALVPVMWIVFNALLLYNIAVKSGRFDQFRQWMLDNLPDDRRLVLLVVAFSFGCLLEGISGFGTPVAITSALLIALGFPALEALTYTLLFNTAPVAFGALGVPITVLGAVTSLPPATLGAMVGRQLPFFALLLPFYVVGAYGGMRSIAKLWPALLVSGASFAIAQFVTSNFLGYQLTDVLSSLTSLIGGDHLAFEAIRVIALRRHREVDAEFLQRLQDFLGIADPARERDRRMRMREAADRVHDVVRPRRADPQMAFEQAADVAQHDVGLRLERDHLLDERQQLDAGLGDLELAAAAVEQLDAVQLLDLPDLRGDRRLAHAQMARGARDAALPDGRVERLQLIEHDSAFPPSLSRVSVACACVGRMKGASCAASKKSWG